VSVGCEAASTSSLEINQGGYLKLFLLLVAIRPVSYFDMLRITTYKEFEVNIPFAVTIRSHGEYTEYLVLSKAKRNCMGLKVVLPKIARISEILLRVDLSCDRWILVQVEGYLSIFSFTFGWAIEKCTGKGRAAFVDLGSHVSDDDSRLPLSRDN
jgi:hypothetical protein